LENFLVSYGHTPPRDLIQIMVAKLFVREYAQNRAYVRQALRARHSLWRGGRAGAVRGAHDVAGFLGRRLYQLSPGPEWMGPRLLAPWTGADSVAQSGVDPLKEDDVVLSIDADEYDFHDRAGPQLRIISTMVPFGVGGTVAVHGGVATRYWYDQDQRLVWQGTATTWRNKVYNWTDEHFVLTRGGLWTYLNRVVHFRPDRDHRVVVFVIPLARAPFFVAKLLWGHIRPLARLAPYDAETGTCVVPVPGGFAVGRPGLADTICVPTGVATALVGRDKSKLYLSVAQHIMGYHGQEGLVPAAVVLSAVEALRKHLRIAAPARAAAPEATDLDMHYVANASALSVEEGKRYGRVLLPRYGWYRGAAFFPVHNAENELQAYKGRIADIKNDMAFPEEFEVARSVWIEYLRRTLGELVPDSWDKLEGEFKPAQRARLLKVGHSGIRGFLTTIRAFLKKENYPDPNDPRLIQPCDDEHFVEFSAYVRPFSAGLKELVPWYAFGKSPEEIAERVFHVARSGSTITASDFSRWDGRVSLALVEFELDCYKAVYHSSHHDTIRRLKRAQMDTRVVTPYGTTWRADASRLSGIADTSAANTTTGAFIAFCSWMVAKGWDLGSRTAVRRALKAFEHEGIYGGDDGVTAGVPADVFQTVSARFGVLAKATEHRYNVPFLARVYPDPSADSGSVPDEPRLLSKLHVSSAPADVPAKIALARKVGAMLAEHCDVPGLGDVLRKLADELVAAGQIARADLRGFGASDRPFWSQLFEPGAWPVPPRDLLDACQTYAPERSTWVERVLAEQDLDGMLRHPYPGAPPIRYLHRLAAVVMGEFNVQRGGPIPGTDNLWP
jgi:hypothetical protein